MPFYLNIFFVIEVLAWSYIEWLFKGKRIKEVVSLSKAKYRRLELEAFGATTYLSERI